MKQRSRIIVLAAAALAANIAADRITKLIAVRFLGDGTEISLFWNSVVLVFTQNSGAFLSLGAAWPPAVKYAALLIMPILVCLYGLYYLAAKERSVSRAVVLASIIGGGLSNLADRLFNDFRVIDFLNFGIGPLRTGILNVADLSVTFGVVALVVMEMRAEKK